MRIVLLLFTIGLIYSCKGDGASSPANSNEAQSTDEGTRSPTTLQGKGSGKKATINEHGLPDPCELITIGELADIIRVSEDNFSMKDATSAQNPNVASCFFRWNDELYTNQGILIQVMTNPIPDEFPMWASSFVASKRTKGEQTFMGEALNFKYKNYPGFGDDGSYSYELGKYVWRIGEEFVFMVAFKVDGLAEQLQYDYADRINKKIMSHL